MRVKPKTIILKLRQNNGAVRKTARELGISPGSVINWRRRARSKSRSGLARLNTNVKRYSTKPRSVRTTTLNRELQREIIEVKQKYGYGAGKINYLVKTDKTSRIIHKFLKDKGLVVEGRNYRRPRYQKTTHMNLKNVGKPGKLQLDVKYVTPELSGLVHTTYLYAVIDIYSRFKAGVILPALDQALTIEALKYIIPQLPKPLFNQLDFIQTDNGLEYQQQFLDFLTTAPDYFNLPTHQLSHHYIHKSSPNENAVIERSFRTDEEEFFWRIDTTPKDLIELNALYQQYLDIYNTFRPHIGINYTTPIKKLTNYDIK
jgi:transposase InsO family protein